MEEDILNYLPTVMFRRTSCINLKKNENKSISQLNVQTEK